MSSTIPILHHLMIKLKVAAPFQKLCDSSCDSFLNIPLGKIMLSHTKAFYDMHSRATI